jgi:hypothetical protein
MKLISLFLLLQVLLCSCSTSTADIRELERLQENEWHKKSWGEKEIERQRLDNTYRTSIKKKSS